ncbi:polysaccharide biosynthesis protein [Dietzia sp. E1]|uniref:polysaccharide biosynthesis protein n=1 Tax=Dietzia sp. E1 TaxID=328361 RepID=UPI0015F85FA5|nr:nucleoside-diphosphate sugar epimerase/dehydratase [Dietzia sp. E1]MBB1020060.1 polysaccharide biosynthesis protein [Dietzia sp. E1]
MLIVAIWIRFDFSIAEVARSLGMPRFYWVLLALVVLSSLVGWGAGLYRGRFLPGSLLETSVVLVVFASVTLVVFLLHVSSAHVDGVPRSTPIIAGAFTVLAAIVLRSIARRKELYGAGAANNAEPALVYGAGAGGAQLIQQLRRSQVSQFRPVAVLDDDPAKRHMIIDGVRVRGGRDQLEEIAAKTNASTLLVAIPSLPSAELLDIRDRAETAGLHVLVLPPLSTLMKGRVAVGELREINVNDLLGRKPARLNQTQIAAYIRGKRVLVTGAGGSIGSELCRQLSRFRPAELMMLDRDESGLHSVQLSIHDQAMLDGDDTILASIRDSEALTKIFLERRPEIVFHAAALKHMPLLEQYPEEAIKTNVIGTLNVLNAAEESGVETFVNISTDKAANPCSALGMSKRIAERVTAARAMRASGSKYVSVRFGNVLGSRGSVLTVFEKQIANGGPVTVTDPDVDRFFMTIPEACQLVLQATVVGGNGETLILDMGEPVKIADVARTLIEQSGRNIDIVYTGLRNNEKLSEELFDASEFPINADRHEALSAVKVPPLDLDRSTAEAVVLRGESTEWLAGNVY